MDWEYPVLNRAILHLRLSHLIAINRSLDGSSRCGALRSEIKEEPEGRGTFAEQCTVPA
jgi:hypothetical protein